MTIERVDGRPKAASTPIVVNDRFSRRTTLFPGGDGFPAMLTVEAPLRVSL